MTTAKKAAAKPAKKDRGPGPDQAVTHSRVAGTAEPVEED